MRGGDLVGAYLVTQANTHLENIKSVTVCIRAVGNLYGFPAADQNFSKEFYKCLRECDDNNTPWDPNLL